jgi:hypothetical protein
VYLETNPAQALLIWFSEWWHAKELVSLVRDAALKQCFELDIKDPEVLDAAFSQTGRIFVNHSYDPVGK